MHITSNYFGHFISSKFFLESYQAFAAFSLRAVVNSPLVCCDALIPSDELVLLWWLALAWSLSTGLSFFASCPAGLTFHEVVFFSPDRHLLEVK